MRPYTLSWIFAVIADLCNWSYVVKFDRKAGLLESATHMIGLPMLIAIITIPLLLHRTYRLVRDYLAWGVFVPRDARFVDWRFIVFLLPFLIHWSHISIGIAADGATVTRRFSYGSDMSIWGLIASVVLISLYQFYYGLASVPNEKPKT